MIAGGQAMRIAIAGGGTGGHVHPALAIADAFIQDLAGADVLFVGTARGLEAKIVPALGHRLELVEGSRLVGGGVASKVRGLASLVHGVRQAREILTRNGIRLVIGVGGYASGAALIAARSLGLGAAVHESNAVAGLTNKVLGYVVERCYLGFDAALNDFPHDQSLVVGNPVRADILAVGAARVRRALGAEPLSVFVVGGSQGAQFLNLRVPELLASVARRGVRLRVRHQVGRLDPEPVVAAYAALGIDARVDTWIDDMATAYAQADLAVSRAGSGAVSELAAAGLPALLVPFPHAAGDHQAANARAFAEVGAGFWRRQEEWQTEPLAEALATTMSDGHSLHLASQAARSLSRGDAAHEMVRDCARWMEGRW